MASTTPPNQDSATAPGLSTSDIVIGILALILALAAVAVAIIQVHQARVARLRPTDTESQTGIVLSGISSEQQLPAQVPADAPPATVPQRYFTALRRFTCSYDSDFVLKPNCRNGHDGRGRCDGCMIVGFLVSFELCFNKVALLGTLVPGSFQRWTVTYSRAFVVHHFVLCEVRFIAGCV
jgi:hypothetical protein